jgi:hypothetical protein
MDNRKEEICALYEKMFQIWNKVPSVRERGLWARRGAARPALALRAWEKNKRETAPKPGADYFNVCVFFLTKGEWGSPLDQLPPFCVEHRRPFKDAFGITRAGGVRATKYPGPPSKDVKRRTSPKKD